MQKLWFITIPAIGFLGWQQFQIQQQLQHLAERTLPAPITAAPVVPVQNNPLELAQLRGQLEELRTTLRETRQTPASAPDATAEQIANATLDMQPEPAAFAGNIEFTDNIENALALGVLDETAWVEMEAEVASLSKEENRAFWMRVFAGIENGELHTLPPETLQ